MDKLRSVVASAITRAARSQPIQSFIALPAGQPDHERGQGLAEYALILAGIAIVAIVSLAFLGGSITDLFWAPINDEFGTILSDILGIS